MTEAPLSSRRAIVTGATRGIGRAIAERLLAAGAIVTATGTRPDGAPPAGCAYHAVDFTDSAATATFADLLATEAPDILVNNAGINVNAPFVEIEPDEFARIQAVNVIAPMLLCQAVVPAMRTRGWGRIVNICSIWSKIARAGRGAYAASKFALDGLTGRYMNGFDHARDWGLDFILHFHGLQNHHSTASINALTNFNRDSHHHSRHHTSYDVEAEIVTVFPGSSGTKTSRTPHADGVSMPVQADHPLLLVVTRADFVRFTIYQKAVDALLRNWLQLDVQRFPVDIDCSGK